MRLDFAHAVALAVPLAFTGVVAACTAGPGSTATQATFGREDVPSFLRDDPGPSEDDPGSSGDHSGSACIACDQNYHCRGTASGERVDVVVHLSSSGGECVSRGSLFACDGTVRDHDNTNATWTALLGGGFRVCEKSACIDCTPTDEPLTATTTQPPPDQGGDASARGGD